jgi:hypothetical protein
MGKGIRKEGKVLAVIVVFSLCGCSIQQLKDLNSSLSKTNAALAPRSAVPSMPQMTEPQMQALHSRLSVKVNDNSILQVREEARDTIEKILTISACYPSWDIQRYLNAYTTGERQHMAPMAATHYHPKSQCLTVTRLDNWRMLARNAFLFRAVFVSDASSESTSIDYEFIKQPDGTWLSR